MTFRLILTRFVQRPQLLTRLSRCIGENMEHVRYFLWALST
jgi:hypothetical protein